MIEILEDDKPYAMIASFASDYGYYYWTVLSNFAEGNNYKIKITDFYNRQISDISNDLFSIVFPITSSLRVILPNGGETINLFDGAVIKWRSKGIYKVSIALYQNDKFHSWIVTDLDIKGSLDEEVEYSHIWFLENLTAYYDKFLPDVLNKNIFKIYITGYEKSADAFRFIYFISPIPTTIQPISVTTQPELPLHFIEAIFNLLFQLIEKSQNKLILLN